MTGEKEIENLIKKIKADKYIIISKSDFTDRAKEIYKKKKNIILWEYNDIKEYVWGKIIKKCPVCKFGNPNSETSGKIF